MRPWDCAPSTTGPCLLSLSAAHCWRSRQVNQSINQSTLIHTHVPYIHPLLHPIPNHLIHSVYSYLRTPPPRSLPELPGFLAFSCSSSCTSCAAAPVPTSDRRPAWKQEGRPVLSITAASRRPVQVSSKNPGRACQECNVGPLNPHTPCAFVRYAQRRQRDTHREHTEQVNCAVPCCAALQAVDLISTHHPSPPGPESTHSPTSSSPYLTRPLDYPGLV